VPTKLYLTGSLYLPDFLLSNHIIGSMKLFMAKFICMNSALPIKNIYDNYMLVLGNNKVRNKCIDRICKITTPRRSTNRKARSPHKKRQVILLWSKVGLTCKFLVYSYTSSKKYQINVARTICWGQGYLSTFLSIPTK
jgi:hypothetical protein